MSLSRAIREGLFIDKANQLCSTQVLRQMLHYEPQKVHGIHCLLRRLLLLLQPLQERHRVVHKLLKVVCGRIV